MMTLNECAQFLQERDNFCILTHRRPDGDTLGSAGALCRGLRLAGKQAWILNNPEAAPKYAPLIRDLTVEAVAADAVLVSVDVAVLVLGQTASFVITSEVVVAETVIVGDVPNTFLQTNANGGQYESQR